MRLIDAYALLMEMGAGCLPIFEKGISGVTGDESTIKDYIDEAPTIDAVEVVRCKDCRLSRPVHREDGSVFEGTLHCSTGRGYQQNVFGREYSVISPDSFCAAGKRKMDAEVEG